ncbi:MAG: SRPBCC family protein [Acidobacteriia bacterium]|nr:SRPBCC family protein [Terriglobia bacterium]
MRNRDITTILAGAYGAGLLTMYFLDPQRGKRRRAELGDTLTHSKHELEKFAGRLSRDVENRTEGVLAEAQRLFQHVPTSDYVLEQRVHTALGRVVSHPSAIEVSAKDGSVFLTGWVLTEEAEDVERAVASIEGVKDFTSYLNTSTGPEHIPGLQGGARRKHVPELLQQRWSPTTRAIAAFAGLGLATYGISRWKSITNAAGIAGSLLLARSILNVPWAAAVGVDPSTGIHVQKTIHIAATPAELFEFWNNPENYPKVFPHIQEVCRLEDEAYQWRLSGLAGTALKWTGSIVRRVPEKLIEWRSLPGSAIENHGIIRFEAAKDGGTRVQIQMSYRPPAGLLGHAFATLFGLDPKNVLDQDFIRLKALFERGTTKVHGHQVTKNELQNASGL